MGRHRQRSVDGDTMGFVAADVCPHGFDPRACLICQTLAGGAPSGRSPVQAPTQAAGRKGRAAQARAASPRVSPSEVIEHHRSGGRSLGGQLLVTAILIALALVLVWWLGGMLWTVLHLLELAVAGAAIAMVSWKLGVRHGRHHPR